MGKLIDLQSTVVKATVKLNCRRCEFMNRVKQEEDPSEYGFSHTPLGMHSAIQKQKAKKATPQ